MKKAIILLTAAGTLAGFCANCCAGGACEFAAPNTLSAAEKAAGWQLLWDGKTLDGWVGEKNGCKAPPEKGWKIENGVLTVLPRKGIKDGKWVDIPKEQAALGGGGDIVTVKEYRDFVFQLDFRLTKSANSGIKYFYRHGWNNNTCPEYQILDSAHPDHNPKNEKGAKGSHRIASLYELKAAHAEDKLRPLGEWNTARLVSKGRHVEHWLNGVKVLEYERGSEAFRAAVANSKYIKEQKDGTWGELPAGRIKIQDHGDSTVSFRNIKILEIPSRELHVYTWADYIAPDVIARFEEANACRIVVDTFDSNESMIANLRAGAKGYDIIMPSSYQIPLMVRTGMIHELDHAKLPNVRRNFDKNYADCIFDPTFMHSVPYAVTYTGFAYRKDKIGNAPIDSWKVFGTVAFKGRMSLFDDMRETIGGALMMLGYSLNSRNPAEIAKAANVVIGWKKNVSTFDNKQYKESVADGSFVLGLGYNSDVNQLILNDPNVGFSFPKEGFTIALDEMVIPVDAKQPDLAYAFINFCYDPDVAAANMTGVCTPMPVAAAYAKIDDKTRKLVMVDAQTLKNGQILLEVEDDPTVHAFYLKAWERIKAEK